MATTIKRTTISHTRPAARPPFPQRPAPEPEPEPESELQPEQPIYQPEDPGAPEQQPVSEVVPVGVEQLARSREIEAMGVEAWKAAHDERDPDQQPQSVAGVGWAPPPGDNNGGLRSR